MRRLIWFAIFTASVCLLAGVSCSARGQLDTTSGAGADSTATATPVNLSVQQPVVEPRGGFDLPAPSQLYKLHQAGRQASYTSDDLSMTGAEYDTGLPNQHVAADGLQAQFTPQWADNSAGPDGLGVAVYPFNLAEYDLAAAVMLSWAVPPAAGQAWLGLSNWERDRWDWYAPSAGVVLTNGFTPYLEGDEGLMLAVVAVTGTQPAALEHIYIGSGISGQVVDLDGAPIAHAKVELPGMAPLRTNSNGEFNVWGLALSDRLAVKVSSSRFVPNIAVYQVLPGIEVFQRINLLPRATPVEIDADAGGSYTLGNGGSLELPAGALTDSEGNPLTGKLSGCITYLDVTDPQQIAAAPGNFVSLEQDDTTNYLQTYGVAEVYIDDGTGQEAQLAGGQTAHVVYPIAAEQQAAAPDTMGLYSMDEATGLWIAEGTAVKTNGGTTYEADLPHFSTWNFDECTLPITTCVVAKVLDSTGKPVPGVCVVLRGIDYAQRYSSFTNSEGEACLLAIRGSRAEVTVRYHGIDYPAMEIETGTVIRICGTNNESCKQLDPFVINLAPRAIVTALPNHGDPPLAVTLDGSASFDRDGTITNFEWDYDGAANGYAWVSTGTVPVCEHTYNDVGAYFGALRLTDDIGDQCVSGAEVYAGVGGGNGGDWWCHGHDEQRTRQSPFNGPQTDNVLWQSPYNGLQMTGACCLGGDGTVYISANNGVYAFNGGDGSLKWQNTGLDTVYSSPCVGMDGSVYITAYDWGLHALNPITGEERWAYYASFVSGSSPVIGYDGTVYFGASDYRLHAVDPATGDGLWYYSVDGDTSYIGVGPALSATGVIYFASNDGVAYAVNPTGTLKWARQIGGEPYGQHTLAVGYDGTVYIGAGNGLLALEPEFGLVKWTYDDPVGNMFGSPAVAADGTVYFAGNGLHAIDPADGTEKWTFTTPSVSVFQSSPALGADGKIYVGNDDNVLYCLEPTAGAVVWQHTTGGSVRSSPCIGEDGTLYVGAGDGFVYAFKDP